MVLSTKSISTIFWETWFYPFNGVAMSEENTHYKFLKKTIFFSCKLQNKKVSGVSIWIINIYSKHSSNKEKYKRKEKVILEVQQDLSPTMGPKMLLPKTHLTTKILPIARFVLKRNYDFRTQCQLDS